MQVRACSVLELIEVAFSVDINLDSSPKHNYLGFKENNISFKGFIATIVKTCISVNLFGCKTDKFGFPAILHQFNLRQV